MDQIVGTTKKHPFVAYNAAGEEVTTLTNVVGYYSVNGEEAISFSPSITSYDNNMNSFYLTLPDTLAVNAYDSVQISITATEGTSDILINIVPDPEMFATASDLASVAANLTEVKAITDQLTLQNIANSVLTARNSEVIEGEFTRIQVERIVAAVLAGIRTRSGGVDTYRGLDGYTPRVVATLATDGRTILSRDGD